MYGIRYSVVTMAVALLIGTETAATLTPDLPSGQEVGTTITWIADVQGAETLRFKIENPDGTTTMARDFFKIDPVSRLLQWTPLEEGTYYIVAEARDSAKTPLASERELFVINPIATPEQPVRTTSTNHPLVALYSTLCIPGQELLVQFRPSGGSWTDTLPKTCRDQTLSVSFLVAGMKPETTYEMRHVITGVGAGLSVAFATEQSEIQAPTNRVLVAHNPPQEGVLLNAAIFADPSQPFLVGSGLPVGCPYATDLQGNLLWYYKEPCLIQNAGSIMDFFPAQQGEKFVLHMAGPPVQLPPGVPNLGGPRGQTLREIDLAGNSIRETNVDRVNEMLTEMGKEEIYFFHHDTRYLPNGHLLVMAGVERVLDDVQGDGPVDVVGDMIIDLNENLEVEWAWDSTAGDPKLPLTRRARRDELCGGLCGPLRKNILPDGTIIDAHDWTHGNAVTYTRDRNIIVSFRHQDWVVKVDYQDGQGTGNVLWRLGEEGDFDLVQTGPSDPNPWFSGQHQPLLYPKNPDWDEMVVYDNANALNEPPPSPGIFKNSRGQVYQLQETGNKLHAKLVTNSDLQVFAPFLGSAQKLANGNYHFLSGGGIDINFLPIPNSPFPAGSSNSTEVNSKGEIVYSLHTPGVVTYRSFRMRSLYETDEYGNMNGSKKNLRHNKN